MIILWGLQLPIPARLLQIQEEYGFDYLTESDGEAIIHLYNKFGMAKAAAMLDGVFACCILDLKANKVGERHWGKKRGKLV